MARSLQVTSYNEFEAEDDEDSLRDAVSGVSFRWRAERNPYGSLQSRLSGACLDDPGRTCSDNARWFAF